MSETTLGGERADPHSKRHLEPPPRLLQGRALHEGDRQPRHSGGERGRSERAPCAPGRPPEQGEDVEVVGEGGAGRDGEEQQPSHCSRSQDRGHGGRWGRFVESQLLK